MEEEKELIIMTRKQLYDEIWELSAVGVAHKYNLHYQSLLESIRRSNIQIPSGGYWTKKSMGKDVSGEQIALSGDPNAKIELLTLEGYKNKNQKKKKQLDKCKPSNVSSVQEDTPPDLAKEVSFQVVGTDHDSSTTTSSINAATYSADTPKMESSTPAASNDAATTVENDKFADKLLFLPEDTREKVLDAARAITLDGHIKIHNSSLISYRKSVLEYNKKLTSAQKRSNYSSRYNRPKDEPACATNISETGLSRMLLILDVLYDTIVKLGGTVESALCLKFGQDSVTLRIAESTDSIVHQITKDEAKAILEYEDAQKHNHWASKPKIREYDSVFNGKIRVIIGERKSIKDLKTKRLEDRLDDLLIAVYERAEENRIEREAREEAARKAEEERRRREAFQEARAEDAKNTIALANRAMDYTLACEIRAYIQAMIQCNAPEATSEWIAWANRKADWYDPTISADDPYLGTREHGKSREEKDTALTAKCKRSFYWY